MQSSVHPEKPEVPKSEVPNVDRTLRLLIDQIADYAIFLLTPSGEVATWSRAAERIKGYKPQEILGQHFRTFYLPEEQVAEKPEYELKVAAATGRFEDEGWRVRKDGSQFWANVIITAIRDADGELLGYGKVTRDLTERKHAEEQLRELSGRLLQTQEQERSHLGRELHDTVGQYLVAVKMSLDGLVFEEHLDDARSREQITDCISHIDRAIQEVRTLSYLLYPPMLEETGLSAAIRWHLDGLSKRSSIQITHDIANVRLPRDAELALFRVVQESLTNVHRHSESKTAHIRFTIEQDQAVLEVQDEGKGVPPTLTNAKANSLGAMGIGIRGMHERLRQLSGKLEIVSTAQGTTVRASVPVDRLSLGRENGE